MEESIRIDVVSDEMLSQVYGGERIADAITTACAIYGVSTIISLAATGVGLPGAGTVGAFCAGWTLGQLLF